MLFPQTRFCHHLFKARTIVNRESWQRSILALPCRTFHGTPSRFGTNTDALSDYLDQKYRIDRGLHSGIFKALQSVHGPKIRIEHFDAFGKSGLEALAASVQEQLKKRQGRPTRPSTMLKVSVPHHGTSFELKWRLGDTVLEVAQENEDLMAEYMEGSCGGIMSCCTCHIYIDQPEFQAFLGEPDESELDMLDLAYEPLDCSRLGCQVKLSKEMIESPTQLEIRIPKGVNNVWN